MKRIDEKRMEWEDKFTVEKGEKASNFSSHNFYCQEGDEKVVS